MDIEKESFDMLLPTLGPPMISDFNVANFAPYSIWKLKLSFMAANPLANPDTYSGVNGFLCR